MAGKILVAYASKYGATQEIAEKVGEVLQKEGILIDIMPLKKVKKLADYQAAVIGAAGYIGQCIEGQRSLAYAGRGQPSRS